MRIFFCCMIILLNLPILTARGDERPNVVLVMTDDQGYGDIAAHGNRMIQTPAMDQLYSEGVRLTNFHADPTCAPTRAALMTGRFSTRTGVWHTIAGRSLMDPRELTLAQIFAANGYRTGLFGKWHLGDNAPLRPQDRGFQFLLSHHGGGLTQTPDFWKNDYFDDSYFREDGKFEQQQGYCTDVWFREGTRFIEQAHQDDVPFFCYITPNAPHSPYRVAEEYSQPYREAGVPEQMANFYGMITCIDQNLGHLRERLRTLGIERDTLLIFMTDNGTAAGVLEKPGKEATWTGFNAGMRGQKVSEYEGGHRVPCFLSWPAAGWKPGREISQLTAHIDLLPTLVELCGLKKPEGPPIDGLSLAPLLRREEVELPDRKIFIHTQRIEHPVKWKQCAVMTQHWRLVNGVELYDALRDPGQEHDLSSDHPGIVAELRDAYEKWWASLEPVYKQVVRIDLGNPAENPASLCCHDWHSDDKPIPVFHVQVERAPLQNGYWAVNIVESGNYEFRLRIRPAGTDHPLPQGVAKISIGKEAASASIPENASEVVLTAALKAGPANLQTWLDSPDGTSRGAYYVTVRKLP